MIITSIDSLSKECNDVSIFEATQIIEKLETELENSSITGVGLAANQIGINAKVCIIRADKPINLVNPSIVDKYDLMEFNNEGCLSFPTKALVTQRFNEIMVKDDLHPGGIVCVGFEAVVVQHEVGHLFGETMFDYEVPKLRPNDKCWCKSDVKYKKCHQNKKINKHGV